MNTDGRPVAQDPDHPLRRCSSAPWRSPGIPPLAGFFSKDEILGESFKFGFYWVWAIGVVVAVMTAFYMWRLMGKTFYGGAASYAEADLGPGSTNPPGR